MTQIPENRLEDIFREKLVDYTMSEGRDLFSSIYKEVQARKKRALYKKLSIAASLLLLTVAASVLYFSTQKDDTIKIAQSPVIKTNTSVKKRKPKEINPALTASAEKSVIQESPKKSQEFFAPAVTMVSAPIRNFKVVLPDGSVVFLEKNTRLSYDADFGKVNRAVKLKGIAFFEVAKNKKIPFIIKGVNSITTVTGTSFNLISKEGQEAIYVHSGTVNYTNHTQSVSATLVKGNKAEIKNGKITVSPYENQNALAWKTGVLSFKNAPVTDVFQTLQAYYGKSFKTENTDILNCTFTGQFTNPEMSQVLDIMALSLNVSWTEKNAVIYLKGTGCKN